MKHIVAVDQFQREWLEQVFAAADRMQTMDPLARPLAGKILATIFYEPSTRTRLSFESAMLRLGGEIISTENAREFSSALKGETIEDTVRIVSGYADAIAMRHFELGAAERAAKASFVPIINAGDGPGEHPTQALLDVYTIYHELGTLDGLKVSLVGDLRFGRAARSLALLLRLTAGTEVIFVAPDAVRMGDDIKHALDAAGVTWREETDLAKATTESDVVYMTRIQKERFHTQAEYEANVGVYVFDQEMLTHLGPKAIVMHPLPRVDEIATDVDDDPRAAYFRQAKNGVYVRMALLEELIGGDKPRH